MLRYLGTAVNQDKAIADKFKADTGIEIQYVAVTTDDVTKRAVTAPNSFDLIDTEYFSLKKIVPTGNLKGIDTKKIKNADKITTLFTKGEVGGKKVGDQGTAPKKVIYLEGEKSKKFATRADAVHVADPDRLQRRHAGHPPRPDQAPDRVAGPSCSTRSSRARPRSSTSRRSASWTRRWWWRPTGMHKYPDKGNMTKAEIDLTIKTLIEAKKAGQFRALWKDFNESVNLMASGEVVIQSMWSPAVTAVRTKGIACTFQPLKEGYRAWAAGFGLPTTLTGKKLDARLRVHQLVPRRLGRRLPESPGLLQRRARDRARPRWSLRVGLLDGRQARRRRTSRRPNGDLLAKAGAVRDGGSYEQRMGGIACWNAVMDENDVHGPEVERVRRGLTSLPRLSGGDPPTAPHAAQRARTERAPSRACRWQAAPFALVFLLFFLLPLALIVAVSLWRLQRVRADPGVHAAQTTSTSSRAASQPRRASASRSTPTCPRSSSACWSGPSRWCSASRSPTSSPSTCARPAHADAAVPALHRPVLDLAT